MAFCGNCGAEVLPELPYCPRCGFHGVVKAKPETLDWAPAAVTPKPEPVLLHLRHLSWGLVLLAVYMSLLAWTGIQKAFFPQPPTPPVLVVDMTPALLAINVALLLLPVCTLLLLGLGLMGLRASVAEVREHLTWRWGRRVLGPLRLVGLLFVSAILAMVVAVALVAVASLNGGAWSAAVLFPEAAFESLLIAMGWCLMVFPAKAIGPWLTRNESRAVAAAAFVISVAALFEACVWFIAAAEGASMLAARPGAEVPPTYPWADGFTALAALAGLLVVAWVARRIVHRMSSSRRRAAALRA